MQEVVAEDAVIVLEFFSVFFFGSKVAEAETALAYRLSKQTFLVRVMTMVENTIQLSSRLQPPSTPAANSSQLDWGGSNFMTFRWGSAVETAADCNAPSAAGALERMDVGDSLAAAASSCPYFCASREAAAGAELDILNEMGC